MGIKDMIGAKSFSGLNRNPMNNPNEVDIKNIDERDLERGSLPENEDVADERQEEVRLAEYQDNPTDGKGDESEEEIRPVNTIPEEEDADSDESGTSDESTSVTSSYLSILEEQERIQSEPEVVEERNSIDIQINNPDLVTGAYITLGQAAADIHYGAACDEGLKEVLNLMLYNMILIASPGDLAIMRQEFEDRAINVWREENAGAFNEFKTQLEGMV